MTAEESMSWFISNMKPELREHCNILRCKTMEEAYENALIKETYSIKDKLEQYTSNIYLSQTGGNNLPLAISRNNRQVNTGPNTQKMQQQAHQMQNNQRNCEHANEICCICSQYGHIGEHCRNKLECSTCKGNIYNKE